MNTFRIENLSLDPARDPQRAKAEKVAGQFEELFVKTFISSMRETASFGGESMFGSGPGADTYEGWFDQNFANELNRTGGIGVARTLLDDMARHGDIADADALDAQGERAASARRAGDARALDATKTIGTGGFDVVL